MRGRRPLLVMLGGGLTFLASLYLPWQEPHGQPPNFFSSNFDGWSSEAGAAASLVALVLAAGAAAMLARPSVSERLPLAPTAFTLLYLAVGGLLVMRSQEKIFATHQRYGYAYGAYLGIAAAAVALLAGAALGRATLVQRPTAVEALGALLCGGLLVSFLLPWAMPLGPSRSSFPGVTLPLVVLAAGGMCLLAGRALRSGRALYAAVALAVLTGAAVNSVSPDKVGYGAWMALGFALALLALAAFGLREGLPAPPSVAAVLVAGAGTVFVIALFLPWQEFCSPTGRPLGSGLGRCLATTGWAAAEPGAVAGVLALVLVLAAVVASPPPTSIAEPAMAIAILTATVGSSTVSRPSSPGFGLGFGYGAYVGFVAAGILLLVALARVRPPKLERGRVLVRLVPLAAALACFGAVALPMWSVLPEAWGVQADVLRGWYAVAGLFLTLHLLRRWSQSARGPSAQVDELVVLPLALLALTALAMVEERSLGMTWGGGILAGLCLLLAALGWKERNGGLDSFRVPEEIWRIDRLPETEG